MRTAVDDVLTRYGGVASRRRLLEAIPSHLTALHRWDVLDHRPSDVHSSVPASRVLRPQPGLVVHRVQRLPPLVRCAGLVTTKIAASVVDSWPLHHRLHHDPVGCRQDTLAPLTQRRR